MPRHRLGQELAHVRVGRVHLVDDEEVGRDGAGAEMRVGHGQRTEQQLIDRADGHRAHEQAVARALGPGETPLGVIVGGVVAQP